LTIFSFLLILKFHIMLSLPTAIGLVSRVAISQTIIPSW